MSSAIILSQGSELTSGQVLDSNSYWLCQQLWNLGYEVIYTHTVPDSLASIAEAFLSAVSKADIVISTGGLGPTDDDHTVRALSTAFSLKLEQSKEATLHLKKYYSKRGRAIPKHSLKMATLPTQGELLQNLIGSALGIKLQLEESTVFCLPGVPVEMKKMFVASIPCAGSPRNLYEIATLGLGESEISRRLSGKIPEHIEVGYQATRRGNIIKLRFPGQIETDVIENVKQEFTDHIYAINQNCLAKTVGDILKERNETIAIAESCTGGSISAWLTSHPGASSYVMEGIVAYSNRAKTRYCSVPKELINEFGAVSKAVALSMAEGMKRNAGTDWAVSVTGIAGPSGGSANRPVGTVHIACCGRNSTIHKEFHFSGTREQVVESSSAHALFMLYQQLQSYQK